MSKGSLTNAYERANDPDKWNYSFFKIGSNLLLIASILPSHTEQKESNVKFKRCFHFDDLTEA